MLANAGFDVRCLATTGSECDAAIDVASLMDAHGCTNVAWTAIDGLPTLCFEHRSVSHTILDLGNVNLAEWHAAHWHGFAMLFEREIQEFRPNIVLTYGGHRDDEALRAVARRSGARVVFGLFNTEYRSRETFNDVDHVLTPSRFLADFYRRTLSLDSTPLPTPIHLDEIFAPERRPRRITMVNPTLGKGAMLVARIADQLGRLHPDIELEIIESRGSGRVLVMAGFAAGFDLRRYPNILFRASALLPRDIYRDTRALLVPSVVEEASARVVAEAFVNGIPVIASDRGGLPESCGNGGIILPLPKELSTATRRPVEPCVAQPWLDAISSLCGPAEIYQTACNRALRAAQQFEPMLVARRYVNYFDAVGRNGSSAAAGALDRVI